MSVTAPKSDGDLLNLLKSRGPLGVSDLAEAMEVTPTSIRQRLTRLLHRQMIERQAIRNGRGRPKYCYQLTEKGSGTLA